MSKQMLELCNNGKFAEGLRLATRTLTIYSKILGPHHPNTLTALQSIGAIYHAMGQHSKALAVFQKKLAATTRAFGPRHPNTLKDSDSVAAAYSKMGQSAKALALFQKNLKTRTAVLGAQHPDTADNMTKIGKTYRLMGKYEAALPLCVRSLAINKKARGLQHPSTLDAQDSLAATYQSLGQYAKALPLCQQSVDTARKLYGANDRQVAPRLQALAATYQSLAQYDKALPIYKQSLEISLKSHGPQHPSTGDTYSSIASLHQRMGDYDKALPLYQKALDIYLKNFGVQHLRTAAGYNNIAAISQNTGDYPKALEYYKKCLAILRKISGPQHASTAASIANLGLLYKNMGDYPKALGLLQESLKIRKTALGPRHPDVAHSLDNLSGVYISMGDYTKALPILLECVEIHKKTRGQQNSRTARAVANLADLYRQMGQHEKALPLLLQSLKIQQKTLGAQHPSLAASLSTLAILYKATGDRTKAIELAKQSLEIRKKAFGVENQTTAISMELLAVLYHETGDLEKAMSLHQQCLRIRRKTLGRRHPVMGSNLNNLALLYCKTKDFDKAEPLAREAIAIAHEDLELASAVQSERQQLAMSALLRRRLNTYVFLAIESERFAEYAFSNVLQWKGTVLKRQRATRALAGRPDLAKLFKERQSVASKLAKLAYSTPKPSQRASAQLMRTKLSDRLEQIQAELSAKSAPFRKSQQKVTVAALRKALPTGAVLIDFLECRLATKHSKASKNSKDTYMRWLAAFIVRSDRPVELVSLGDARGIDTEIQIWRKGFGLTRESRAAGLMLRKRIWAPLEQRIKGAKLVLVSPDGALGTLPLSALPGNQPGSYVLEQWPICVIPAPQLLVGSSGGSTSKRQANKMLLIGGVDYNAPPTENAKTPATKSTGKMRYSPLPGAKAEMLGIEKIYRSYHKTDRITALAAANATEKRFRSEAPGCSYLHLATHGFFASPEIKSILIPQDDMGSNASDFSSLKLSGVHPGLLSGLALTGANRPDAKGDDGVLTTEEVGAMNLSQTDLVVLSACDTGLGQVAGGEGLLGLQRAFQAAGVRSVVAGMWKVHDYATMLLMQRFYRNMWEKKMGKLDALREAQLWMLREGSAHGRKPTPTNAKTAKPTRLPPFFWGAFVLSGDWR